MKDGERRENKQNSWTYVKKGSVELYIWCKGERVREKEGSGERGRSNPLYLLRQAA